MTPAQPGPPPAAAGTGGSFVGNPALRGFWYAVGRCRDLPAGGVTAVRVLGVDLAVWRAPGGELGAAVDRCPHRQAPLSLGTVTPAGCLRCPYHGWEFDAEGACRAIPSQRVDLPVPARNNADTVRAVERYGLVWICLDEPVEGIVEVAEAAEPAYRVINAVPQVFAASAGRVTDNFLDASHFAFVHEPTFGSATDPVMPPLEVSGGDRGVAYRYRLTAANPAAARITTRQATDVVERTMHMSVHLPFTTLNTVEYTTGLRHVILNATTPVDDEQTLVNMTIVRNDDHSIPEDEAIALDLAIVEEDRRMLERIPGPFPLDPRVLAHAGADRAGIEWMRRLRALLDSGRQAAAGEPGDEQNAGIAGGG